MVHVFKTTVRTNEDLKKIKPLLENLITKPKWNFDLEDCDNILRVESAHIAPDKIIDLLEELNFECSELK